jgi:hypothetical protein
MDTEPKIKVTYATEYVVIIGYVSFFCLLIFACLGYFFINRSQYFPEPTPVPVNPFAANLPPITPTPHVSSNIQFEKSSILFQEDFNNNQNRWLNAEDDTKEKIQDGRLYFQGRDDRDYAILSCEACPYLEKPYFFEASLSTNIETDETYGIVFNRSESLDDFYIFIINPESTKYYLFHHTFETWTLRASGASTQIQPYSESTTLGVYANEDLLELYINGVIVDSYMESGTSFHPGFFGLYTNNSWFGVNVDHIVVYEMEK